MTTACPQSETPIRERLRPESLRRPLRLGESIRDPNMDILEPFGARPADERDASNRYGSIRARVGEHD
jgi:hypothetical protein